MLKHHIPTQTPKFCEHLLPFNKAFYQKQQYRTMENKPMAEQTSWLQILTQCKNNIQKQIAPLLKTLNQQQPNLGIGAGGDPIKQIDLVAENAIIKTLKSHKI